MANRDPKRDITPCFYQVVDTSTGLEVFDKAESEINSHFTWLHQILNDRNRTILDKLSEKRAEFVELETARVGQIEEIETMKQQLLNLGVKSNMTNLLREKSIRDYDDALNGLETAIETQTIIFERFADKFQALISSIDLTFVEEDYTTRINPINSIDRDSILQSISIIQNEKLAKPKETEGVKVAKELVDDRKKEVNFFKLAFDSETNHILALNRESNNILVFQQDGTLIACLGEEFGEFTDICIDTLNRFLYVLDGQNWFYKFNITTYQLLLMKEYGNEEIEDKLLCLDVHNDEIYVGTTRAGVHIFSAHLGHSRSISTYTFGCIDILCRDEDILICSLYPAGLNIFFYNGDLIRNIPLFSYSTFRDLQDKEFIPFQFSVDRNNLIFFSNPIDHCICFYTFGGHLVHKIAISPEEDNDALISGLVFTNEGRIFVSVYNSKHPLRCY